MVRIAGMSTQRVACWLRGGLLLTILLPFCAAAAYRDVADIKSFGLLDISGRVRIGYSFDDRERRADGGWAFEERTTWEEEVFVMTETFVYHPGFLNMELGGGPLLVQQQFSSDQGAVDSSDTLLNVSTRFNFLELKRYPFSLYYDRSHPSVTSSLAGRFLTQQDRYGAEGRIGGLFNESTSLHASIETRDVEGSSQGWVVDDDTDRRMARLDTSFRGGDSLQLRYDRVDIQSASGSPLLPIQRSTISRDLRELKLSNRFGKGDSVSVNQVLTQLLQDRESATRDEFEDWRYSAVVNWQGSDDTRTFVRYVHRESQRPSSQLKGQHAELGLVKKLRADLSFDSSIEGEEQRQTGFQRDVAAVRAALNYKHQLPFGSIGLALKTRGARTNQKSTLSDIEVLDETLSLVGTAPVELANGFVVIGSVVVSNDTRSQTFVEGFDYRVVTVGEVTSIQRLPNGLIMDGEVVLIEYRYATSGTAEFDTVGAGVSASLGFLRNFNAFVRLHDQDTRIRDGMLTNPVNDRRTLEYGLTVSNKFLDGWALGGQYRHVDQDEDISPFESDLLEVNLSTGILGSLNMNLAVGWAQTEYKNSPEDVDQVSYRLGIRGPLLSRGAFNYDAAFIEDTGGSVRRRDIQHRLNYRWTYRRVRMVLAATYAENLLGASERTNTVVSLHVTRDF